jgi:hypothetical protein
LAVTAHNNTCLNTAVFDHLQIASAAAPPMLTAEPSGASVRLSWPAAAFTFNLYRTGSLVPPVNWSPVTNTPANNSGTLTLTLLPGGDNQFFRLALPPL